VTPGSTCACGRPIAWYDNIPILSWFILRGRARCCGAKFSLRYPAIELLTAGLFLACWLQHPPAKALAGMLITAMLICASFIDFDHMIIPDRFSIGAAAIGVVVSIAVPSLHDFRGDAYALDAVRAGIESIKGVLIGSGVVLWIGLLAEVVLRKEAMGFGDVKLVGGIGAFFGWEGAVFCIFGGAVLGTIGLGIAMLVQAIRRKAPSDSNAKSGAVDVGFGREVPFGPMLAAGSLLYFLWLYPVVDDYFAKIARMLAGQF
jgi:leader peptidase (prepilin peptidase) / N-methyltransferase